jgi:signal transduction histidine kinase
MAIDHAGIEISIQDSEEEILCDPLMEKVFQNLISNSINHGQGVTSIDISFESEGRGLAIVYEDDGVGIPSNKKKRIFERGVGNGTGYGLYLVSEILQNSKMSIIENGVPGEGARFEIRVPEHYHRS